MMSALLPCSNFSGVARTSLSLLAGQSGTSGESVPSCGARLSTGSLIARRSRRARRAWVIVAVHVAGDLIQ